MVQLEPHCHPNTLLNPTTANTCTEHSCSCAHRHTSPCKPLCHLRTCRYPCRCSHILSLPYHPFQYAYGNMWVGSSSSAAFTAAAMCPDAATSSLQCALGCGQLANGHEQELDLALGDVLPTCPRNHLCGHLHHPRAHRRCRHLPPPTTIAPPQPSSPPWLPTPATPRPIAVHAHFRGAVLRVTASVILSCSHLSRKQSGTEWPWRKRCSWCSSCTIRVGNVGGRLGNRCGCGCRGKHGLPRVNCTC